MSTCQSCRMCVPFKLLCAKCKQVAYCSRGCQNKDWSDHKRVCVKKERRVQNNQLELVGELCCRILNDEKHAKWHKYITQLDRRVTKINMSRRPLNIMAMENLKTWRTSHPTAELMKVQEFAEIVKVLTSVKLELMIHPDFRDFATLSSQRFERYWKFISRYIIPILTKSLIVAYEYEDEIPKGVVFPLNDRMVCIGDDWMRDYVNGRIQGFGGTVAPKAEIIKQVVAQMSNDPKVKPFTVTKEGILEGFDINTKSRWTLSSIR